MNWAPYPASDGRHYVFVRDVGNHNWEVFLGDLAGGPPIRLTYSPGFDGLPSLSKNGKKMLFARSVSGRNNLATFVMDMSSFDLGPDAYKGIPETKIPPNAFMVTDFTAEK
jgi:Tol biopolymer transport system component